MLRLYLWNRITYSHSNPEELISISNDTYFPPGNSTQNKHTHCGKGKQRGIKLLLFADFLIFFFATSLFDILLIKAVCCKTVHFILDPTAATRLSSQNLKCFMVILILLLFKIRNKTVVFKPH